MPSSAKYRFFGRDFTSARRSNSVSIVGTVLRESDRPGDGHPDLLVPEHVSLDSILGRSAALCSAWRLLVDTAQKRVLRDNRPVGLSGMPLAMLCYFVEHAADGRLVTRQSCASTCGAARSKT